MAGGYQPPGGPYQKDFTPWKDLDDFSKRRFQGERSKIDAREKAFEDLAKRFEKESLEAEKAARAEEAAKRRGQFKVLPGKESGFAMTDVLRALNRGNLFSGLMTYSTPVGVGSDLTGMDPGYMLEDIVDPTFEPTAPFHFRDVLGHYEKSAVPGHLPMDITDTPFYSAARGEPYAYSTEGLVTPTDTGVNSTGFSMGQYGVDDFGNLVTASDRGTLPSGYAEFRGPAGGPQYGLSMTGPVEVSPFLSIGNMPSIGYKDPRAEKDITVANTIKEALARADEAIAGMGLTGAAAQKASALASAELGYLSADQLQGLQAAQQAQEQAVAQASAAAAAASAASSGGDWGGEDTGVTAGPAGAPQGAHHAGSAVSKAVDRAVQNAVIDALIGAVGPGESALSATYAGLGYGGGLGEGAEGLGEGYGGFGGGWT